MDNFVAIDFETANGRQSSVCSVGIVIVKDGEMVDRFYSLICPTPNYYSSFCQAVHGLGPEDTDNAPQFPEVWEQAERKIREYFPYIADGEVPLVAHNAHFDSGCLGAAFSVYDMGEPPYEWADTLAESRLRWPEGHHNLDIIAAYCGYDLTNHHHALADAEACAVIAKQIL